LFLLYVLLIVAVVQWLGHARATSWDETLWVVIHPINGDGSERSAAWIHSLSVSQFEPIARFMSEQGHGYGLAIDQPMQIVLGSEVTEQPPAPPTSGNPFAVMLWSLKLRYWTWRVDRGEQPPPADIEVYVRYFDPEQHGVLGHSLGLRKGRIGVVNAFASADHRGSNQVVIAHEMLHTLGASDKYDPRSNQPLFPSGYADPGAQPTFPQALAELMGGRIPLSPYESVMPRSLAQVVIGQDTAREIRWLR
ncbi:MAG: hypothetical protein KDK91_03525, partial [Gammaproteobacteria bacterium]|nr:hypothetical protein [Gammaproteobacteria bacterium]